MTSNAIYDYSLTRLINKYCILFVMIWIINGFSDPALNQSNTMITNHLNNEIDRVGKGEVGFTGDMSLSIPIMKVPGRGGLDFELTVSYKSEIKVDQAASTIGLGWYLEIGKISRIIRRAHDRYWDSRENFWDVPDAFSISAPLGSGKFSNFQTPDEYFTQFSDPIYYMDKWIASKIEYTQEQTGTNTYDIQKFIITDLNGIKYVFEKSLFKESTCVLPIYWPDETIEYGNYLWLLTSILSSDYIDGGGNEYNPLDGTIANNKGNWIAITYSETKTYHYLYAHQYTPRAIEIAYPERIVTPTHVAIISYQNEIGSNVKSYHEVAYGDDQAANEQQKRMTDIKLYKYSGVGSEPTAYDKWIYRAHFIQSDDLAKPYLEPYTAGKTTLNRITIESRIPSEKLEYRFEYDFNPIVFYPDDGFSIGRDTWNYNLVYENYGGTRYNCASAWSLSKIILPTGGWIEYEYENDRYYDSFWFDIFIGGGCRLKTKKIYDGMNLNSPATYNYYYGSTTDQIGYVSSLPSSIFRERMEAMGYPNVRMYVLDDPNDHYIGYDLVTEEYPDGSKIERYYTSTKDNDVSADGVNVRIEPRGIFEIENYIYIDRLGSYEFQRGLLKEEKYYKANDSIVKTVTNNFDYSTENAVLYQYFDPLVNLIVPQSICAWTKLNSVNISEYDDSGINHVDNIITFEYNQDNGLISKKTETNSNGKQKIYEVDYAFNTDHQEMKDKNMLSQISRESTRDDDNHYYSYAWTRWDFIYGDYRPNKKWNWKEEVPTSNTPVKNLLYFDNPIYDDYGNLRQFTNAKEITTTIDWRHNYAIPVATITNAEKDECFFENFDDQNIDDNQPIDWYTTGSYWTSEDGNLHWTSSGTSQGMCADPQSLDLSNFIAEFDMKVVDGNTPICWGGFQFRKTQYIHTRSSSGYLVYIRENNQLQLYDMVSGYGNILGSFQLSPTPENWHHVKVFAEGNNIKVFADGYLAIDVIDGLYQNGQYIGFEAYRAETKFDNLRIYPSDALCTSQSHDFLSLRTLSKTDENGTTRYYEYDDLDRLVSISNNDFQTLSEYEYFYSWDGTNNFDPINPNYFLEKSYRTPYDYSITKTYSDGLGRNIQVQQQNGSNDINISTDYDFLGRVSRTWKPYTCVSNNAYEDDYDASNSNPNSAKYYYNGTNGKPDCGNYPFNNYFYRNEFSKELSEEAFPGEEFATGTERTVTNSYLTNGNSDLCDFPDHSLLKTERKDENGNYVSTFIDKFGNQVISRQFPAGGHTPYEEIRLDVEVTNDSAFYSNSREFTVDFDQEVYYHCILTAHDNGDWAQFKVYEDGSSLFTEMKLAPPGGNITPEGYFTAHKNKIYKIEARIKGQNGTGTRKSLDYVTYKVKTSIETSFEYDIVSKITKTTDPSGKEREYKFNTLGQLIAKTTPDLDGNGDGDPTNEILTNPDERFTYDSNGNLRFMQNAILKTMNPQIVYFYRCDVFNRIISEGSGEIDAGFSWSLLDPDQEEYYNFETDPDIEYHYDLPDESHLEARNLGGRLSWIKYKYGESKQYTGYTYYSYNNIGNLEWQILKYDGLSEKKISYQYNLAGQVEKLSFKDLILNEEFHLWYDFDNLGKIKEIYHNNLDIIPTLKSCQYEYWPTGQIKNLKLGEITTNTFAQEVNYKYNSRDWLTFINDGAVSDLPRGKRFALELKYYNLDQELEIYKSYNGNIASFNPVYSKNLNNDIPNLPYLIKYDNLNRITEALQNSQTSLRINYTYSENGNFLSKIIDNVINTYGYTNPASNRLTSYNNITYGYDYNGNMASSTDGETYAKNLIFNSKNQLQMINLYHYGGENDQFHYGYDADRNRILYISNFGGTAENGYYYFYDNLNRLIAIYSLDDEPLYFNIWGNDIIGKASYNY